MTIDWGYDIVGYLQKHSDLIFTMIQIDNLDLGVRAELIKILIGFKKKCISYNFRNYFVTFCQAALEQVEKDERWK